MATIDELFNPDGTPKIAGPGAVRAKLDPMDGLSDSKAAARPAPPVGQVPTTNQLPQDRQPVRLGLEPGTAANGFGAGPATEREPTLDDVLAGLPFAYLSGPAGTGKTFLARQIIQQRQDAVLCATTGIAAVNLGDATTINSLLSYFDTQSLLEHYANGFLQYRLRMLRRSGVRLLVVDEVSMMAADQLTILCQAMDELDLKKQYDEDLGEVSWTADDDKQMKLLLVGDFCFARGTRVMRADGRPVLVEEVQVGTALRGPDGQPRVVQKIKMGAGPLYRVDQTNGDSYIVNEHHSLALRRSADGQRKEGSGRRYPHQGDVLTMPVSQFRTKSRKFRECFVGYKAGLIEFPPRTCLIEPYFLGVWLGDGDSDGSRITTADPEIIEVCRSQAAAWGLGTSINRWARTKAIRIRLTNGRKAGHVNPLWQTFRRYNLDGRKHIPDDYLYGTSSVRLALLAGLLDTDGSWGGNRYTLTLAQGVLAHQVKQLGDQLGFRTAIRKVENGWYADPAHGEAWCVTIGGDTWRIPCRVARKQSKPRSLGRSRLTSTLSVTPVGEGGYVGFEVDGDHLFLLTDGTVTHNCQLPPIDAPFAFESPEWDRFKAHTYRLSTIRRQGDQDFVRALQAVRRGRIQEALPILAPRITQGLDFNFDGTTIVAKNDAVDRINGIRHAKLAGKLLTYKTQRVDAQQKDWLKLIPEVLEVKVGALVMVLSNKALPKLEDEPLSGFEYVNGDLGTVLDESPHGIRVYLHRTLEEKIITPVVKEWKEATGKKNPRWTIKGSVTYMPLRLAYATSVHKSQSLSLDAVQVSIVDGMFHKPGMLYVALSRCRTLEGLRIVGNEKMIAGRCGVDPKIAGWL